MLFEIKSILCKEALMVLTVFSCSFFCIEMIVIYATGNYGGQIQ